MKSAGPAPGDSAAGTQPDGLPTRASRPARDFSADAAQDAVILSVTDLAAAQEAVTLARQDQENERRSSPAGPSRRATPPPPSWGKVLLTTVQLWVQRRLHVRWPGQTRWRVLTLLVVAAVLFGAGAITIAVTRSPAHGRAQPGPPRPGPVAGGTPTPAAIRAAVAARTAAARWIAAPGLRRRDRVLRPADVRAAAGPRDPGGAADPRSAAATPTRWAAT